VLLALLVGPSTVAPAATSSAATPTPTRFGTRAALVIGAWLAICALAVPFLTSEELEASQAAVARGDRTEALERAASAQSLEPWAASPRLQLALIHEESGDLGAALQHIREAIDRDETDWRLHLVAARLATKAGDIPAARAALREARRLNPRSPALRQATAGAP
jgi:Tfp pilus assembly protein PilF